MAKRQLSMEQCSKHPESAHNAECYVNISELRDQLPQAIKLAARQGARITVGPRGGREATLIPYWLNKVVFDGQKKQRLAWIIVDQLLADAPQYITVPAIEELSRLSVDDLIKLLSIDTLPLTSIQTRLLKNHMDNPEILDRLMLRFNIAKDIATAESAGLYEAAEHYASDAL